MSHRKTSDAFGRVSAAVLDVNLSFAELAKNDPRYLGHLFAAKRMLPALAEIGLKAIDERAAV